jgi:RecB family exonuclease
VTTQTLFLGSWGQLEAALDRRLASLRAEDGLQPLTVVCGSAAAAAHLRRAVTRASGGLILVDFTTIHRLASELAAGPLRRAGRSLADETEILRLIGGVISGSGASSYFSRIRTMPGLPRALRRAFKDLREARVAPGQLAGSESSSVQELASLYAEYVRVLEGSGRADDASMYEAAAEALDAGPGALASAWVGLYGLYDLAGTQRLFVEQLAQGRRLDAFVPGPYDAGYSAPARELYATLGCTPERVSTSEDAGAATAAAGVEIVSVEDAAAERREVLRRVVAAAEQGISLHEVAVVHADAGWRGLFVESLEACGIPVAATVRRPTVATRLLSALLACVSPVSGPPLDRAAVVDLASACALLGRLDPGEVARWDRLSRDARVVAGADQWRVRLTASADRSPSRAVVVRGLLGFVDEVEAVREAARDNGTWDGLAGWLAGALGALGVPADDPVQSAVHRLARLSDIEARVTPESFCTVARDALAEQAEQLGSLGRTGVAVVSPEQVRGLRFPLVLFGGLVEGLFPARPAPDPLLDDETRARLSETSGGRLTTTALRSAESDLLFALVCETATRSLVFLRARSRDGTGAPQLPSRHLVAFSRHLVGERLAFSAVDEQGGVGGRVTRVAASPVPHPGWPGEVPGVDQRDVDAAALMRLHELGERRLSDDYLAAVLGAGDAVRRIGALRSRLEPRLTAWDGLVVVPGLAEAVFSRELSVSAVEDYVSCPFVFYARHVLRASAVQEPEEEYEPAALDVGLLVHAVLERTFTRLSGAPRYDLETALDLVGEAVDEVFALGELEGRTGYPLAWQGRRRRLAHDVREAVRTDPAWRDDLRPALFEWSFGDGHGPVVEVLGRRLAFRGRVDRIDRDQTGARVRLLDYKTGRGEAEKKHLDAGEDVQLSVYRLAAAALSPPPTSIECAFRFVTRAGRFRDIALAGDLEETTSALSSVLGGFVAGVEKGVFVRMHGGGRCRWCDLSYACGARTPLDAQKQSDAGAGADTAGGADG